MKVNFCSNFNFCKSYLGKTEIRGKDGALKSIDFVEYDPFDEKDRLEISTLSKNWGQSEKLIKEFANSFNYAGADSRVDLGGGSYTIKGNSNSIDYRFFGLEDKNGETLAVAHTSQEDDNELEIELLQTNPKEKYGAKTRNYIGLGMVLVSKIVELAKKAGIPYIFTLSDNDDFWYSSGLFIKEEDSESTLYLVSDDFDKYIDYKNKKINS